MIQKTFNCCGVQYGRIEADSFDFGDKPIVLEPEKYFKLVMANNKGVENWVGVSEGEYNLAKKGFER